MVLILVSSMLYLKTPLESSMYMIKRTAYTTTNVPRRKSLFARTSGEYARETLDDANLNIARMNSNWLPRRNLPSLLYTP